MDRIAVGVGRHDHAAKVDRQRLGVVVGRRVGDMVELVEQRELIMPARGQRDREHIAGANAGASERGQGRAVGRHVIMKRKPARGQTLRGQCAKRAAVELEVARLVGAKAHQSAKLAARHRGQGAAVGVAPRQRILGHRAVGVAFADEDRRIVLDLDRD